MTALEAYKIRIILEDVSYTVREMQAFAPANS